MRYLALKNGATLKLKVGVVQDHSDHIRLSIDRPL